jgi:hypothetical protein
MITINSYNNISLSANESDLVSLFGLYLEQSGLVSELSVELDCVVQQLAGHLDKAVVLHLELECVLAGLAKEHRLVKLVSVDAQLTKMLGVPLDGLQQAPVDTATPLGNDLHTRSDETIVKHGLLEAVVLLQFRHSARGCGGHSQVSGDQAQQAQQHKCCSQADSLHRKKASVIE